ncbi:MAG: basic secretory protein-like protein [Sciscionella sp.]
MTGLQPTALQRYRGWLVAAVVVMLCGGITLVRAPTHAGGQQPNSPAVAPAGRHQPAPEAEAAARPRLALVTALLRRRATALSDRDRAAFMATVDPHAAPAFLAAQRRMFDNLAQVRFSTLSYQVSPVETVDTTLLRGMRGSAAQLWAPRVKLRYGLAGVDSSPTTKTMGYLFARRAGSWYLESDTALDRFGVHTWRGPWDFGPCVVTRVRSGLVLAHPGSETVAKRAASEIDSAVRAITAVWGNGWPQRVAVLVPASSAEMRALVGSQFAVDSIAAVAVADAVNTTAHTALGQRVVLNPDGAMKLSQDALRVILRHEITHIATRADTVDGAPMWMLEGFADYVGYHDSGMSLVRAAPELAAEVRSSGPPAGLPTDDRFDAGAQDLDLAYQQAWSMNVYLAVRFGQQRLVTLYHEVAGAGHLTAGQLATTLTEVTGRSYRQLIAGWQAFLRTRFG